MIYMLVVHLFDIVDINIVFYKSGRSYVSVTSDKAKVMYNLNKSNDVTWQRSSTVTITYCNSSSWISFPS